MYGDLTCEQWCEQTYGGTWKQTSYNTHGGVHNLGGVPLRKNFAGVGYTYDMARDAFIPKRPYPSWVLDDTECVWKPPIALPLVKEGDYPRWNEAKGGWDLVDLVV